MARFVAPVAVLATVATMVSAGQHDVDPRAAEPVPSAATVERLGERTSRDATRPALEAAPGAPVLTEQFRIDPAELPAPPLTLVGTRWASTALLVRTKPSTKAAEVGTIPAGSKLKVTASVRVGYRYVSFRGHGRWVRDRYLTAKRPGLAAGSISGAACSSGSAMESGLTPDAVRVHRALCARFPQIGSFGGLRGGGGYHATGQAVDAMISDSVVGWQVARWVRANAARLGVSEVIFSQHIWTVQRSSEGWRGMSDRGSATANHYDHVHVSVYGNRGAS